MNSRTFSFYRDCCYHEGGHDAQNSKEKGKTVIIGITC